MKYLFPVLIQVLLLILICLVLQGFSKDRSEFKTQLKESNDLFLETVSMREAQFVKEQREALDKVVVDQAAAVEKSIKELNAHANDQDLHMPLESKLKTFVPRPVADDRYISLKSDMAAILERLADIELSLNIKPQP